MFANNWAAVLGVIRLFPFRCRGILFPYRVGRLSAYVGAAKKKIWLELIAVKKRRIVLVGGHFPRLEA